MMDRTDWDRSGGRGGGEPGVVAVVAIGRFSELELLDGGRGIHRVAAYEVFECFSRVFADGFRGGIRG